MKIKRTLRSIFSIAIAVVCCIASISPIPTYAKYATEKSIDFSEAADAELFSTTYGGWGISEGVYKANTEWATTYLTDAISLATDKEISFDFCLVDDNDVNHQFNIGLVNVSERVFSGGVSTHFYYSSQHTVELVTLNGSFGNTYEGWLADTVADYFDGQNHTMTISIVDKTASFKIDGNEVLKSAEVGLDSIYLVFQSTSTEYAIDNILIESAVPEYRNLEVDFDVTEDGNVFATTYGGWSISEDVYKANTAWANTYLNGQIPLDEDKEISFDFCLQDDNDAAHQFNVGLVNEVGASFSGGISAHFYYSSQHAVELVTLNGAFGNTYEGWIADTVGDYFDGQNHTMTISIVDKTATFKIDGNDVLNSAAIGFDALYLVFQSTSTEYIIDNLKIKEVVEQEPEEPQEPQEPTVPEYTEMDIDFDVAEDGSVFATTNGGFTVVDGVYKANTAWATTYLNCEIPLEEDKEISFDFCLKNNGDVNHQFNFGLVDIDGSTVSTEMSGHFYRHAQHGELFTLNRDFSSPFGTGWIADNTDNFNDGELHTMHIQIKDGKANFYIDKNVIFQDVALNVTSAYFIMQFTSVDSYIDNLKVSDTLSALVTTPENPESPENPEQPTVSPEYSEVSVDFDVAADGNVFATNNGGWTVSDGVYKANSAWATTYLNCKIPLNEDKEISFDFCLKNNGDKNHQFNIGFVDINGSTVSKGFAGHFYCHAQHGELFTLNKNFGNPVGEGWIADNTDNYNDGKVHTMLIQIKDGKVKFCIDKRVIFQDVVLGMSSAYFIIQSTSVDSYVDNFKVSDTLTDTTKYSAGAQNTTSTPSASNMGSASFKYKEMSLGFDKISDGDAFATNNWGWSVSDGVFKPNTEWATTYLNCLVPLNEEKEISFDFCMKDVADKAHQFNIGFVNVNGEKMDTVLAGHFYHHAQYGELFTLNKDYGNPIGEGWIADNTDNFNDGEVHSMMIRMKDGKADFYIDGKEIFNEIALDAKSAYFILQFTSVESYIDNFRVSDTLTYIPDYPITTPDPEGDEVVKSEENEDKLVGTKGEVVKETTKDGLSPAVKITLIAGVSVVVILGLIGGAVILKKRKQVK